MSLIGKYAPVITLPDANGEMFTLTPGQGKPIVLFFYPKSGGYPFPYSRYTSAESCYANQVRGVAQGRSVSFVMRLRVSSHCCYGSLLSADESKKKNPRSIPPMSKSSAYPQTALQVKRRSWTDTA